MRALSNRILDALAERGPMEVADLAITLREPTQAIAAVLLRLPPGEVEVTDGRWSRPVESEPAPEPKPKAKPKPLTPEAEGLRWLPHPQYPHISAVAYRCELICGGYVEDSDAWAGDEATDRPHGEMRWWVGVEDGTAYEMQARGYAPDAATARRLVEACLDAAGLLGLRVEGGVAEWVTR